MTDIMPEGTKLGPIGDEVVFENEHVRVWKLVLEPGETQDWHQHFLDYLVVPVQISDNVMIFADGRENPTTEVPGDALWRTAGTPHKLVNRGKTTYRNVLVEIKAGKQD